MPSGNLHASTVIAVDISYDKICQIMNSPVKK